MAPSLGAYRGTVSRAMEASTGIDDSDASEFLTVIGAELDRLYSEVEQQATSATLRRTFTDLAPQHVRYGAGLLGGLALMWGQTRIVHIAATAAFATIGQGLPWLRVAPPYGGSEISSGIRCSGDMTSKKRNVRSRAGVLRHYADAANTCLVSHPSGTV